MKKSTLEKGKIPPQALELEDAILGALMIDKRGIVEIDFLEHSMFYREDNQLIFKAIKDVYIKSGNVDLLTVSNPEEITVEDLMEFIKGPDFPTG